MKYSALRRSAAAVGTALLVASCNGSGLTVAGGGIGGTGVTGVSAVSVGPITQFGSIFVNGVEHDLTNATIVVNGSPVTAAGEDGNLIAANNLALGQVVRVEGTINADGVTGTATTVTFSDDVKGPITDIQPTPTASDPATTRITVLGQVIVVDSGTYIFRTTDRRTPLAIGDLQTGVPVEVSGLTNNNGDIHATSVEINDGTGGNGDVRVKGTIQGLDSNTMTFNIRNQAVDYSNAAMAGLSNGPADGLYVEITGQITVNNMLVATDIKLESQGLGQRDAPRAEQEGFVTAITSPSEFMLDGQDVVTNAQTAYEDGAATDVVVGAKLEVEGMLTNGVLTASKIKIKSGSGS